MWIFGENQPWKSGKLTSVISVLSKRKLSIGLNRAIIWYLRVISTYVMKKGLAFSKLCSFVGHMSSGFFFHFCNFRFHSKIFATFAF